MPIPARPSCPSPPSLARNNNRESIKAENNAGLWASHTSIIAWLQTEGEGEAARNGVRPGHRQRKRQTIIRLTGRHKQSSWLPHKQTRRIKGQTDLELRKASGRRGYSTGRWLIFASFTVVNVSWTSWRVENTLQQYILDSKIYCYKVGNHRLWGYIRNLSPGSNTFLRSQDTTGGNRTKSIASNNLGS